VISKSRFILIDDSSIILDGNPSVNRIIIRICNYIKKNQNYKNWSAFDYNNYWIKKDANASNLQIIKNKNLLSFFQFKLRLLFISDKEKNIKKTHVRTEHITAKKKFFKIENIIKANEDIADKKIFEINGYHVNKIGKYYRNCNSIFESEKKFH
jgi:hypothetical protein